jgi:hypothetical protein
MPRLLASALLIAFCGCGRTAPTEEVLCLAEPQRCAACAGNGTISGRVCAPDGKTWVNGATVSVEALDCAGATVTLTAQSGADGWFTLDGVPAGTWTVHATLGAFWEDAQATVKPGVTTQIATSALCVAQRDVKIAVVSGTGDKIETVLDSLRLHYTLVHGTQAAWAAEAAPFLSDLERMKQFDFIVIDCAAGYAGSYQIDLGAQADVIGRNLHDYVLAGGALYASDWGLVFASYAAPGSLDFVTRDPTPIASPLDATQLMGFAPQTVTAAIVDPALRAFLGKDSISIKFPRQSNAVALHWGLMSGSPGATVLASADAVQTCGESTCGTAGPTRDGVPLLVRVKVGDGSVVYSSFHNIAQSGADVAQLLKYVMLSL